MPNQKNEWNLQGNVTKKEFKVLYDALKCAKIHLSTGPNAISLENAVLVLLHMCKNGATTNRAVTELCIMFRDDRNVSILTSQWLLGMISAINPDKVDAMCRRMLEYDQKGIQS